MMLPNTYMTALALGCLVLGAAASQAATREYFIAAEDVAWDYAPSGKDLTHHAPLPSEVDGHTKWHKTRFIEYTNAEFHTRKAVVPTACTRMASATARTTKERIIIQLDAEHA